MKRSILILGAAMACPAVLAAGLEGVIVDSRGAPVAGAEVQVVGSVTSTRTDEEGRFELADLPEREVELHLMAPGFGHRNVHVDPNRNDPLRLELARTALEIVDVVGLPWHASLLESAQPVNVLAGENLRRRQAATLGETLRHEVGVHTTYYGPAASSPIIRGLEGPRVMVTQNGLDAGDASRVGPDHLVATEASTATQIEILRGPATLFYGSGAIGGVVNVVDDRVPKNNQTSGELQLQHSTVADENLASGSLTSGAGQYAFHVDGFWRDADDYRIPVPAETDHTPAESGQRRLENSAYDAHGFNVGGSYLLDDGFVGLSFGRLDRTYGIPGHSHGHEETATEEDVYANVEQDRAQLQSEIALQNRFFSALNTRIGYTDYVHHEIEFGQIFTTFENTSYEGRAELFHHPLMDWQGVVTLHYKHQDFSATGAEAFTPPSKTETLAIALMEERHFGDVQLQLGARMERVEITADRVVLGLGEPEPEPMLSVLAVEHVFEPVSLSGGAVWDFTPGYNIGLSISHAQRAPSAAELLSYGAHLGTNSFEVGALFRVHEDGDGDYYVDLNPDAIELEKSNNLDISLRKFEGDLGFVVNLFYNRMSDMYYQQETGLLVADDHAHDHDHDHDHDHGGDEDEARLPLYVFTARDANLYGIEGQLEWQVSAPFKLTLLSDYIRGELRDGGDLPRIPPLRIGTELNYQSGPYNARLGVSRYFEQDRVAAMETRTPGYTLMDAELSYDLNPLGPAMTVYLKGENLTDEEARPHSSFLKDKAPLPGRNLAVGIRATF